VISYNIVELKAPATTDPLDTTTGCHGDVVDSAVSHTAIKVCHCDNYVEDTIPHLNTLLRMRHDTVAPGRGTGETVSLSTPSMSYLGNQVTLEAV